MPTPTGKQGQLFGDEPSAGNPCTAAPGEPPLFRSASSGMLVVREVVCKTVLNRGGIDDYSFNPYLGCAHGCGYCYARFMQRFHPHEEAWGEFVDVKVNAAEVMARQVRRLKPGTVFTCSACDGWQEVERHYRLTRRCCQVLLEAGFALRVLTKSELVLRDLDLFAGRDVRLGVTLTTADEGEAKAWEPGAATVAGRVRVLKAAKEAGLATSAQFAPLLPGVSDTEEGLEGLFALAAEAGVDHVWTDAMNPRPRVWESVQGLIRRRHPHLYELYRRVLFDDAFRQDYLRELHARVARAAARAGLADRLGT